MFRFLVLLILIFAVYQASRWFSRLSDRQRRRWLKQGGLIGGAVLLLWLIVSGKLSLLFGVIMLSLTFLFRILDSWSRYGPLIRQLWLRLNGRSRQSGEGQGSAPANRATMTRQEALKILGLEQGASEQEIILAHRRLIARLHPDKGGSDYLAAQINLAKKILLK